MDKNRRRLYSLLLNFYKIKLSGGNFTEDYFENEPFRKVYRKIYFELFRHLPFIEKEISIHIKKDTPIELFAAIVLGTTQILFLDDIPDYAAVNETVSLVNKNQRGFVNAVLRNIIKEKGEILKRHSIFDDYPVWFIDKLRKKFSENELIELLKSFNTPPENYYLDFTDFTFKKYEDIEDVPKDALACDVASANIPLLTKNFSPQKIMDSCAAPGGKTVILSKLHTNANIDAFEKSEKRCNKLVENINRYRCKNVNVINADVLKYTHSADYDLILVDPPCSALGTIRRHPEVRYLRDNITIKKNAKRQLDFLNYLSQYLKNGGYIVYSVCSIEPEETFMVVERFLEHNKNFTLLNLTEPKEFVHNGYYYTLPHKTNTDGFFGAVLIKDDGKSN